MMTTLPRERCIVTFPMPLRKWFHGRMDEKDGRLLTLAVLALVAGAAAGLIGAVFRLVLVQADQLRDRMIAWAHGEALLGFVLVVLAGAAAALVAAWLVRRFAPHASG